MINLRPNYLVWVRILTLSLIAICGYVVMYKSFETEEYLPLASPLEVCYGNDTMTMEYVRMIEVKLQQQYGEPSDRIGRSQSTCNRIVKIQDAHHSKYFDIQDDAVSTVMYRKNISNILESLHNRYFDYGSNNCNLLEARSKYGNLYGLHHYGASCVQNISALAEGFPLRTTALGVGLPDNFSDIVDNEENFALTFIHIIRDGVALVNGDVLTRKSRIVPQKCQRDLADTKCPQSLLNRAKEINGTVFTISQSYGTNFFHSTIEDLPRLAPYLQLLKEHPDIKIHAAQSNRFLTLLGIPKSRIVSGNIRAKRLLMPAGTTCGRPALFTTQLLSHYLNSPFLNDTRDLVILVKRSSKARQFAQHDAILDMINIHAETVNLKVEVYGDNPVPNVGRTSELFRRAVIVVAPHGAGESNVIFSRPGTVLVEGLCYDTDNKANLCYRNLAQALGLRYYGIIRNKTCVSLGPNDIEPPFIQFIDLYKRDLLT